MEAIAIHAPQPRALQPPDALAAARLARLRYRSRAAIDDLDALIDAAARAGTWQPGGAKKLRRLRVARRRRGHRGQATHSSAVVSAVRTGITSLADALVSASVELTAAIICAGAAGADPSQQDQFVALLEQEQIPPIDNVPGLIARAHQICGELDGGPRSRPW
jgi:hypothetical protein